MLFSSRVLVSTAAAALALCNVAVAIPQGGPISKVPTATVPAHCSTTMDDFEHTTAWVKTYECYTYTRTAPSSTCPTLSCPPRPTDEFCPQIIEVSSVTVPCATDCCPTTSTSYVATGACPTCAACPIPTEWITYTTGCEGTPTITSATIETPPWNTPGSAKN
ncbi:hypothetical protein F4804DRAFT_244000 [Jackrogersella minutella]|nr:hypothetical protein F4804DRAFT_244000 [Jackrogersella minutella]